MQTGRNDSPKLIASLRYVSDLYISNGTQMSIPSSSLCRMLCESHMTSVACKIMAY